MSFVDFDCIPFSTPERLHTVTGKGEKTTTSTMMMISDRKESRFLSLSDGNFTCGVMMGLSLLR